MATGGLPVLRGSAEDLDGVLADWLTAYAEGTVCVVSDRPDGQRVPTDPRVRSLTPELVKGLEFDLVVLVDPGSWRPVDQYVAITRATRQLVLLGWRGPDAPGVAVRG